MDPLLYLTALRRRWWLIAALTVLGLAVGFASGSSADARDDGRDRSFIATHKLAVIEPATPSRQGSDETDPQLEGIPALLAGGDVPRRAAELMGEGEDPDELSEQVESTSDTGLGTLDITATDRDAVRAEAVADAFAAALLEHLTAEEVERSNAQKAALQQVLDGLEPEIARLSAESAAAPTRVQETQLDVLLDRYADAFEQLQDLQTESPSTGFVDLGPASAARSAPVEEDFTTPSSRTGRAAIGGLAGLLVGVLLVLVVDRLDTTIRSAGAAEAALGMPVLVSVPALPRKFRRSALPAPGAALGFDEALRLLRSMLMVAGGSLLLRGEARVAAPAGEPSAMGPVWRRASDAGGGRFDARSVPKLQTLLVTSATPSEGKSTLVAGLARTMGLAPSRVIVLDLDLREPALHRLLEGPAGPGIASLFEATELVPATAGSSALPAAASAPRSAAWVREPDPSPLDGILVEVAPGVRLAPAGTGSTPTYLLSAGVGLVQEARTRADLVLVDAPPLLSVSEASELLPAIDGVVVAVFAGRTTVADAMELSDRLALLGAPVVGAVLIGAPLGARSRRAYQSYGRPASSPAHTVAAPGSAQSEGIEEPTRIGST